MALHQSHTQLLRTVSTPKQSMTLLVAGQFVGNSIPPRVVPCATANSPMFAALASSPIVTTPINPNVLNARCHHCCKKRRLSPTSYDQSPPLLKHLAAWEYWLADDFDRDFILHCVKYGASLIDPDKCPELIPPASVPNGRSVTTEAVYPLVTQPILDELANGNYIQCDTPPKIVSALSAIPKPDGNIRLIHDMSHPDGLSANSYASKDPCKYQTIADALALIQPSWFMAVLDLKSAYRSVHIRDSEHCLTGLSWKFAGDSTHTSMFDSRLPFGSQKLPAIFNRFTQAVTRMMRCKGHNIVVYLDDFWLCGPNFEACKAALDDLVSLLRTLGFQINWKKITDPCQKLAFLGIMIDTVSGELSLKPDKLMELIDLTKKFLGRKRASRRQLEQLAGKLCWAAHVVPWGTTHTRPIFTLLSSLKQANHKGLISGIKWDLTWWLSWLQNGQNRRRIWRAHVFPEATKSTYSSHLRAFLHFCAEFSLTPCPAPTSTLLGYAAFLARSKCYTSVTQYLNIIR